jgi:hypothetical protein
LVGAVSRHRFGFGFRRADLSPTTTIGFLLRVTHLSLCSPHHTASIVRKPLTTPNAPVSAGTLLQQARTHALRFSLSVSSLLTGRAFVFRSLSLLDGARCRLAGLCVCMLVCVGLCWFISTIIKETNYRKCVSVERFEDRRETDDDDDDDDDQSMYRSIPGSALSVCFCFCSVCLFFARDG